MITEERAEEIWAQRSITNSVGRQHASMTEEEDAEIRKHWKTLGGGTSYMTAFFEFLNGRVYP